MHIFNCASRHGAKTYGRIRETMRAMDFPGCHLSEVKKGLLKKEPYINIYPFSSLINEP